VVDAFRRDDVHVLLATCTWHFAAEYFQARYGLDAVCGTRMVECDGVMTGVVARCVDGRAKADFLAGYCARHDIPLVDCVAVGDSASDSAMFALAGRSIALNGSQEAKRAASSAIDTDDVRDLALLLSDQSRPT
jgi:phosphoserine phosphatase